MVRKILGTLLLASSLAATSAMAADTFKSNVSITDLVSMIQDAQNLVGNNSGNNIKKAATFKTMSANLDKQKMLHIKLNFDKSVGTISPRDIALVASNMNKKQKMKICTSKANTLVCLKKNEDSSSKVGAGDVAAMTIVAKEKQVLITEVAAPTELVSQLSSNKKK
jgi:hypothetical protein